MLNKTEKKLTKLQLTITLILVLFISITGSTYAYFAIAGTNSSLTGNMATVNLTLNVTRVFPKANSTNTGVIVPQLSVSGSATSPLNNALKSGCIDTNQNVVCHVYKIIVQNAGGTATQVATGKISFYGDQSLTTSIATTMPNLKWRLVSNVNETTPANSTLGSNVDHTSSSTPASFVTDLTMATDSSFTYYIIVWISETNSDQPIDTGKTFYGKIEFNSANGTGVTTVFA